MKKTTIQFTMLVALALSMEHIAPAQLVTTSTTLSSAVAASSLTTSQTQVCLTSATGVILPSAVAAGSFLAVDREALQVARQGSSSTCFIVKRGQLGTGAWTGAHNNGATVYVGQGATSSGDPSRPFGGVFLSVALQGPCTRSAQYSLPLIITADPRVETRGGGTLLEDCQGGYWVTGSISNGGGFTAYTTLSVPNAIATASITDVNGKIWYSQMTMPVAAKLTGACVLNGATVGTDKWIFALYDSAGNLLANTATAGTTTATASKYQCIAFTATQLVYGGYYYLAVQGNGTTDNFQSLAANGAPTNYLTSSQTGTFGTLATLTPLPTTFTASQAPIMMVY